MDFSYVTGFAALGDSFSAGLGAGAPFDQDQFCARGTLAFPNIINQDERMGEPAHRTFQFLACSGAKSKDVVEKQVPLMGNDQSLITMSIGGNDVGFADILNVCVFQFTFDAGGDKACDDKLDEAKTTIQKDLSGALSATLNAVKPKLSTKKESLGILFVLGYAKFFEATSKQCDDVAWSFWWNVKQKQKLTTKRRGRMNELVDNLNAVIRDAVKIAGP